MILDLCLLNIVPKVLNKLCDLEDKVEGKGSGLKGHENYSSWN